jgi:DNA (cytosine-5)-methyltransferase 1
VFAVDHDEAAAESYNENFGPHCVSGDIERIVRKGLPPGNVDVVIGGPPCQGFSLLNKKKAHDPRKQLWRQFMQVVERKRPIAFVMENVPELLASEEFRKIDGIARRLGYSVVSRVLNSADYGVPQRRRRAFVVGTRRGVPSLPEATHADPSRAGLFDRGLQPWATVRRAIGDLPPPEGTEIRKAAPPLDLHFGRNPLRSSVERYKCVPEGGNRSDLQRKRPDLTPRCWVHKKGGTDLFGRLWWDRPCFTIRTEFFKPEKGRYLHPSQHRPITHREAARLMSFPDDFKFEGSKIEIARQIGNAVPPLLAECVARELARVLDAVKADAA